jgi:TolB protein
MYDFATDELKRITDGKWVQMYPAISGDRIVWQDYRACDYPNNQSDFSNVDVWMYDLKTGKEYQITTLEGSETEVQISGDKLFYRRWTRTDPNVFAVFVQDLKVLGF